VDNASSEYFFLTDFLGTHKSHDIQTLFHTIFEPTLVLSTAFTKHLATATADTYSILLSIRTTQKFAFSLQKRRMPALDGYINATRMALWPRFQAVMDAQAESLRRFGVPTGGRGRGEISLAPHIVTVRFAGLLEGLLTLSEEEREDEPLVNRYFPAIEPNCFDRGLMASLGRVRSDFEAFLTKWSASIGDGPRRERFLYNNYSLVKTVLSVPLLLVLESNGDRVLMGRWRIGKRSISIV
jgi:hypothetical protein